LPPEKQAELLDFIAFLKVRQAPFGIASVHKTAEEIVFFFRSFKVEVSGYSSTGKMPVPGKAFIDTNIERSVFLSPPLQKGGARGDLTVAASPGTAKSPSIPL